MNEAGHLQRKVFVSKSIKYHTILLASLFMLIHQVARLFLDVAFKPLPVIHRRAPLCVPHAEPKKRRSRAQCVNQCVSAGITITLHMHSSSFNFADYSWFYVFLLIFPWAYSIPWSPHVHLHHGNNWQRQNEMNKIMSYFFKIFHLHRVGCLSKPHPKIEIIFHLFFQEFSHV